MLSTYQYPTFQYIASPDQTSSSVVRHPVIVVGAGPVGLAAAIDLAQAGIAVVVLDDDNTVSVGSRGLCYAKRTLEVLDRLGVGDDTVAKGVSWNVGRTFLNEDEVFNFNLTPEAGFKRPGMVNLQQYYLEEYEVKRARQLPNIDLRYNNRIKQPKPITQAVMFCIMDVSGSMDEEKKEIGKACKKQWYHPQVKDTVLLIEWLTLFQIMDSLTLKANGRRKQKIFLLK